MMRTPGIIAAAVILAASQAVGQVETNTAAGSPNPAAVLEEKPTWSFTGSVATYVVPDSQDYAQPTITADRHWLHLEARYNYEALKTGSAWIGYNYSVGEKLAFEATPMVGGIFGDVNGIAPGFKIS